MPGRMETHTHMEQNKIPSPFTGLGSAVPSILWDAFEDALHVNMVRLAKDIAKTIGQPVQPLLDAMTTKKVRPYLFEATDDTREIDARCDYVCCRPDAPLFLQPCGQPVFWGHTKSLRCPEHLYCGDLVSQKRALPVLKRLEESEEIEEALYSSEDGTLYDKDYVARGQYDERTGSVYLFTVMA